MTPNRVTATIIIGILTFSGCSRVQDDQRKKMDVMVTALVAKGDQIKEKDEEAARAAFKFAHTYASEAMKSGIAKKLESLGGQSFAMSSEEISRMRDVLSSSDSSYFENFAPRSSATDFANLKMLLNEDLVGTLRYTTGRGPNGSFNFFTHVPKLMVDDVRTAFGKPPDEKKEKDGTELLTYGPFRVVAKPNGKVSCVLFALP